MPLCRVQLTRMADRSQSHRGRDAVPHMSRCRVRLTRCDVDSQNYAEEWLRHCSVRLNRIDEEAKNSDDSSHVSISLQHSKKKRKLTENRGDNNTRARDTFPTWQTRKEVSLPSTPLLAGLSRSSARNVSVTRMAMRRSLHRRNFKTKNKHYHSAPLTSSSFSLSSSSSSISASSSSSSSPPLAPQLCSSSSYISTSEFA